MRFLKIVLSTLFAVAAVASQAQITISTTATGNIGSWGTPASGSTPTYAQVITDPTGNPYLQSVTYYINNPNLSAISFMASVYAWNGTTITGSALYTSGTLSVAPTAGTYAPITVSGIDTQLTPGNHYAVLYSTLGYTGSVSSARFQTAPDSAYAGGTFAYNNSVTPGGLNSGWAAGVFGDLAFRMDFTPTSSAAPAVPEPSSIAVLMSLSLTGAAFLKQRKNAKKAL